MDWVLHYTAQTGSSNWGQTSSSGWVHYDTFKTKTSLERNNRMINLYSSKEKILYSRDANASSLSFAMSFPGTGEVSISPTISKKNSLGLSFIPFQGPGGNKILAFDVRNLDLFELEFQKGRISLKHIDNLSDTGFESVVPRSTIFKKRLIFLDDENSLLVFYKKSENVQSVKVNLDTRKCKIFNNVKHVLNSFAMSYLGNNRLLYGKKYPGKGVTIFNLGGEINNFPIERPISNMCYNPTTKEIVVVSDQWFVKEIQFENDKYFLVGIEAQDLPRDGLTYCPIIQEIILTCYAGDASVNAAIVKTKRAELSWIRVYSNREKNPGVSVLKRINYEKGFLFPNYERNISVNLKPSHFEALKELNIDPKILKNRRRFTLSLEPIEDKVCVKLKFKGKSFEFKINKKEWENLFGGNPQTDVPKKLKSLFKLLTIRKTRKNLPKRKSETKPYYYEDLKNERNQSRSQNE